MGTLIRSGARWLSALKILDAFAQSTLRILLTWILVPYEFGIYGSALLFIGFIQAITQTGIIQALIYNKSPGSYLNTAWTIEILRGLIIYLLIYIFAPFYIDLMSIESGEEVVKAIRILGLMIVFDSCKNISVVLFDKNIDFNKVFKLELSGTLVKFFATLFLSLYLESFLGIVYGTLLGYFSIFIMSYVLSNSRPRIELDIMKAKIILNYGFWIFLNSVASYLMFRINELFILKFDGIEELAIFQLALFVSIFARDSISFIQLRVLFPVVSKYQSSIKVVNKIFITNFEIACLIYIPIGTTLFILSNELVHVFFDSNWQDIASLIPYLSIAGIFASFTGIIESFFKGLGMPRHVFLFSIISIVILILNINLIFGYGPMEISMSILIASISHFFLIFFYYVKFAKMKVKNFGLRSLIIFIGACTPLFVLTICGFLVDLTIASNLIFCLFLSFFVYLLFLFLLQKLFHLKTIGYFF